ncbi:MAG: OpgC domain-containing protein [Pseudomonadota bacterium]
MSTATPPKFRDPRLDFFRGLGMFIILMAHITDNPWTLWIPARFGFSDATEIFVFCSGMASALAFGALFSNAGWLMGTLRILHRMWQVYWVHIGVFLVTLMLMLAMNQSGLFDRDEVKALNLVPFLRMPENIIGLMTLTYVPNYFDILPMYLVILAMIPVVMALAKIDTRLVMVVSVALWMASSLNGFNLPAEYWFWPASSRQWFFDPFAWQLVFFTGFAFMSGWLPAPPVSAALVVLAGAVVILSVPFAWHESIGAFAWIREWRAEWAVLYSKPGFGILRFVHFLALAYLAWVAVGPRGERLSRGTLRVRIVAVFRRVGQQSLAVFAASMIMARVLGAIMEQAGRGPLVVLAVNLAGFAIIIGVAYGVSYIKRQPWKDAAKPAPRVDSTVALTNGVQA